MKTTTALNADWLAGHKAWSEVSGKLCRIGLHLTCLLVHPVDHFPFHISGIVREFNF